MKENDPHQQNVIKKCPVCGHMVLVDQYDFGECQNCGWLMQSDWCLKNPDKVLMPNIVSYNRAIELYKMGKAFKPTFDEFLQGLENSSEMQFEYNGAIFSVTIWNGKVNFCRESTSNATSFDSIKQFAEQSAIDGKFLKDIWQEVNNVRYIE